MKVTIIGSGNVGTACAQRLITHQSVDNIFLIDKLPEISKGKSMDLNHFATSLNINTKIESVENYSECMNSEFVVITAGKKRDKSMSRKDLFIENQNIVKECCLDIKQYFNNPFVIILSNPLDLMTLIAYKTLGFKRNKVIGMAGCLDISRFKYFLSKKLNISTENIQSLIIGTHNNDMIILEDFTTISGIPFKYFLSKEELENIIHKTKNAGKDIVDNLGISASLTPGAAAADMIDMIIKNKRNIICSSVYLNGEYGIKDICLGMPILMSENGFEKILELDLNKIDLEKLQYCQKQIQSFLI